MRKTVKTEIQSKVDMAAEQLARLFIEQAKWKRVNKKVKIVRCLGE